MVFFLIVNIDGKFDVSNDNMPLPFTQVLQLTEPPLYGNTIT